MAVDTTLDRVATELLALLDARDFDRLRALLTDDAQGVDEISRGWKRGREAIERYFTEALSRVSEIHSTFRDSTSRTWGDVGVVTGVLEQTYRLDGEPQQITAPTTLVLVRQDGAWKIAVVHSVPLPADEA
jgi:uncharacterized protein (TIGR02246 family)